MTSTSRYLPASDKRVLACVAAALAAFYGLLAIAMAINVARAPISLGIALGFAVLSWGMWRLKKWARWISVFALWFCVIVIPVGALSPFAAMDWQGGAPRWEVLASWIAAGIALGLFVLHILGKHKKEFRW